MYLYLGQETMLHTNDIVGIFDLDTTSLSKRTREYLARAEKEGRVVNASNDLPKSFVLDSRHVYISQLSSSTLKGRIELLQKRKF